MHFDLRQLARHGGDDHVERTYQPEQFDASVVQDEQYTVVAPVHLALDVHKDRDAYRVTGTVRTRLQLECGRCLEPFEVPVDSAFELRYVPAASNAGEGEREIDEDDLTTAYYRDERIDLGELMHEQFVLALPMKPLCAEGCKGLCPHCGANLNKAACDCSPAWTDPRMAALEGLLPKNKES